MTFNGFANIILNKIREKYKGKYHAKLIDFPKNNGGTELCLNVSKFSVEDGVVFKLEPYYEFLDTEMGMEDIIEDISKILDGNEQELDQAKNIEENFEAVKDKIVYRLINKKSNSEWLKQVPYRDYFDMAIDYYILLSMDSHGQMSISIKHEHIEKWGISEDGLYELAKVNTPRLLPGQLTSMGDTILKIAERYKGNKRIQMDMKKCMEEEKEFPLYELSQENSLYGATVFIYPDVLKQLAELIECDLIIIPASIYEVLISPYEEDMDAANIKALLEHANDMILPFEEVLSNSVFRYSREADYIDYMWPDNPS